MTTTTATIEVSPSIKGWQIRIDRFDLQLTDDETILMTAQLLKKGIGIDLADIMPTTEQRDYVMTLLGNNN